jgi:MFS family permease
LPGPLDGGWSLRALLSSKNLAAPFAALKLHPLLIPLTALCFFFAVANGAVWALMVSFLVEERGLTLAQAGLAFAAMQGAGVVGRLVLGWLGDRTGKATLNLLVQAFAAAAAVALFALIPTGAPVAVFAGAAAFVGGLASSWQGIALAELSRVSPPDRVAEGTAGASIIGFSGFSGGPAACALAVSLTGSWVAPLLGVAAMLLVSAAILAPKLRT